MKKYTTDDYFKAFQQINMTKYSQKMLLFHYHAPDKTLTATEMSKLMGYKNYNAANLYYGKLSTIIGKLLGWDFTNGKEKKKVAINILANLEKIDNEWLWCMKPICYFL